MSHTEDSSLITCLQENYYYAGMTQQPPGANGRPVLVKSVELDPGQTGQTQYTDLQTGRVVTTRISEADSAQVTYIALVAEDVENYSLRVLEELFRGNEI
jgi:hypothetical protein